MVYIHVARQGRTMMAEIRWSFCQSGTRYATSENAQAVISHVGIAITSARHRGGVSSAEIPYCTVRNIPMARPRGTVLIHVAKRG